MDRKRERGKTFYKVHWAGYGSDDDTWEPESNLKNCKAHIKKFLKQQGPIVEVKLFFCCIDVVYFRK